LNKLRIVLIGIALFFTMPGQTLTLQEAMNMAVENNRDLKIAQLEKDRANERYWEALSGALPQLNFNSALQHNYKIGKFPLPAVFFGGRDGDFVLIDGGQKWDYSFNLSLDQPIYTFGKVGAALEIADHYEEATANDYMVARNGVLESTYRTYISALLLKEQLAILTADLDNANKNYAIASRQYELGLISQLDILQAKVAKETAVPERIAAESQLKQVLNQLKTQLNIPLAKDIDVADDMQQIRFDVFQSGNMVADRPEFQAEKWRLNMFDENQSIEFARRLPEINATALYRFSGSNNQFERDELLEYDAVSVAVNFSWTLFSGFRNSALYEQSVIDYQQAKLRLAMLEENFTTAYENAKLKAQEATDRLQAALTTRKTATQALDIALVQKENGAITEVAYNRSQVDYKRAHLAYLSAMFDYNNAQIDLAKSLGVLDKLFETIQYGE
jgi:outer membrane protein TolC